MKRAVCAIGMVSPFGLTARDHAFFLRARIHVPGDSPFIDEEGNRLEAQFCSWIGARAPVVERVARMAEIAMHEACDGGADDAALLVTLPDPRPGFAEDDAEAIVRRLARFQRARGVEVFHGDAGGIAALRRADALLEEGRDALVVAADSFVSTGGLDYCRARRPSAWSVEVPPPSEAAAAVLFRRSESRGLGILLAAIVAQASASDENDLPPDGKALSAALRGLPECGPIRVVVGQAAVDDLRAREWSFAHTRNVARVPLGLRTHTIEHDLGRVGAAAGLANVVYGFAVLRHGTLPDPPSGDAPFVAWAISPDGTTGVALARAGAA
jgi:hypothetical protein